MRLASQPRGRCAIVPVLVRLHSRSLPPYCSVQLSLQCTYFHTISETTELELNLVTYLHPYHNMLTMSIICWLLIAILHATNGDKLQKPVIQPPFPLLGPKLATALTAPNFTIKQWEWGCKCPIYPRRDLIPRLTAIYQMCPSYANPTSSKRTSPLTTWLSSM